MVHENVPWYGRYLTIAHVLFKKTELKAESDYLSYFDFHFVLVHFDTTYIEFFYMCLLKKRNRPLPSAYLLNFCRFFFACVRTLEIRKNDKILKSGKNGHFAKAVMRQNGQN